MIFNPLQSFSRVAIVDGDAMNVMNSFARLGVVWSGGHEGLMTNVLRGEWGMKGFGLTDFSGNAQFESYGLYMKTFDVARGLLAGTDCWDSSLSKVAVCPSRDTAICALICFILSGIKQFTNLYSTVRQHPKKKRELTLLQSRGTGIP